MTASQRLTIERAKIQNKLNCDRFVELRSTDPDFPTVMAEQKALRDQLNDVNNQLVKAIETESDSTATAFNDDTPEHRERAQVTGKADLGVMVGAIVSRRALNVGSAEAEAQAAWELGGDAIPFAMLAEYRVASAPASGGGASPFVGYRFPASVADFANVSRPRVAPGTPVFPSITAATSASRPAEAGEVTDDDPTLRGELLTPRRVQASTKISVEDRARFGGMSAAIAQHLAGAVAAGLDDQALVGDEGFFDASSGPLTDPTAPGSASTYANYADMLNGGIDGRYASAPAEVGVLVGQATYTDGAALYRTTNSEENIMERIARVGRLRVSAAVPAAASNIQSVLVVRGTAPAAVQPIWDGLTIEDIYSRSTHGEIGFTVVTLADFSVTQPSAYVWQKSNLS